MALPTSLTGGFEGLQVIICVLPADQISPAAGEVIAKFAAAFAGTPAVRLGMPANNIIKSAILFFMNYFLINTIISSRAKFAVGFIFYIWSVPLG